ncbi:MAG: putative GH25 family protein [Planctomycetota bacterium]|jgi:uncharacterized GH25 family protein
MRSLALPAFIVVLLGGLWFCSSILDGLNADSDLLGGDEVFAGGAGNAGALVPLGGLSGLDTTSRREVIQVKSLEEREAEEAALLEEEIEGTRLRGTVSKAGGIPVAGATIYVRKSQNWLELPADLEVVDSLSGSLSPRYEAQTNEEGEFILYDVPASKYSLSIRSEGSAPLIRSGLAVPEHEDFDLGGFRLELGIRLAGRVMGSDGKGAEGVQVLCAVSPESGSTRLDLPGRGIPLTETDIEGRFEVDCLAPGAWHLIFDAPGYRVQEKMGNTSPAGSVDYGLLILLDEGLVIRGKVVGMDPIAEGPLRVTARRSDDQPSGAADDITGAEKYRPRTADVLADGGFEVRGLAPGMQYMLRLSREAKPTAEQVPGSPLPWKQIRGVEEVEEMAGGPPVEFKYREEARVLMSVKSAKSSKAIESLLVSVTGKGLSGGGVLKDEADEYCLTFPQGAVAYENLLPAELGSEITVRVRSEGYQDFEKKGLMLRPGEILDLGDCELDPAPKGSVRVVDDETDEPIDGALVRCSKSADSKTLEAFKGHSGSKPLTMKEVREGRSDSKGLAKLTLWDGSICICTAVAEGYQPAEPVSLVPPFDDIEEIRLTRGGTITVRVVDEKGGPVAGMYVEHKLDGKALDRNHAWDTNSSQKNKTGEAGEVVFSNLAKGKHSFTVMEKLSMWGQGGESAGYDAKGDIYLDDGESKELELSVNARGGLRATILEAGQPLAGALVKLVPVDTDPNRNNWFFGGGNQDPRSKVSDHAGVADFTGIKVGAYFLKVSHPERRMVVLEEVRISESSGDITIEVGLAIVEGTVTDLDGNPLEGVSITVTEKESRNRNNDMNDYRVRIVEGEDGDTDMNFDQLKKWAIYTDRDGHYILRGLTPGRVLLIRASHTYVMGSSNEVHALGSDEYLAPLDFKLERAGVLRIDTPGISRKDRGKYRVSIARIEGGEEVDGRSSRLRSWRSYVTLSSLQAGTWKVSLRLDGKEEILVEREVQIRLNETTQETLYL